MLTLCTIDNFQENDSKGFQLEGQRLFVVKKDGEFHVYRNLCPHRGVNLEWVEDQFLDLDKAFIQCATHGALFRIDNGLCVQGPCLGQRLESVDFSLVDGEIRVDL